MSLSMVEAERKAMERGNLRRKAERFEGGTNGAQNLRRHRVVFFVDLPVSFALVFPSGPH
jgi:hypothetical protein